MKNLKVFFLILLAPVVFGLQSCDEIEEIIDAMLSEAEAISLTGWLKQNENVENIPVDITPFFGSSSAPARTSFSIEDRFPPIGDQGQYGTCVAWAVGYSLKTALNGIEAGWTTTQLANPQNQSSPKDLWFSIPTASKGANCGGTYFEAALDAIIANGIASLSRVPYTNMGNCTGTRTGDANNKLANYRTIAQGTQGMNVANFKSYLDAGRPIAFGAQLGDRFMNWRGSGTLSSDTYGYTGQHANHAMVLAGYDDTKNAFLVLNSWGTNWGDNGKIWVDYDFFLRNFCFAAFVAQNPANPNAVDDDKKVIDPTTGTDLLAHYVEDWQENGRERVFYYDVFNSGTTTIRPSANWSVVYMYYNARNANDYEIIYYDLFTDKYGGEGDYGIDRDGTIPSLNSGFWNNFTAAPGENINEEYVMEYTMPNITGDYYLVLMADAYDVIREVNEDNNFYFVMTDDGKPLQIVNGIVRNMPSPKSSASSIAAQNAVKRPAPFSNTDRQTPVMQGNLNAYTPQEIQKMLIHEKNSGRLEAKIKAFAQSNADNDNRNVRRPRISN